MSVVAVLEIAFAFWFVQQVNDAYNAFTNRQHVPKLYWLSAGASFVSGVAMFYALFKFVEAFVFIFTIINQ